MQQPLLVISAIALRSGGTLSILHDCLQELAKARYRSWDILAFVTDPDTCLKINPFVQYEKLDASGNYLKRIYYEYVTFKRVSERVKPSVWFSLHDMSPRVTANFQAVYCHNPSPFYSISAKEFFLEPMFGFFTLFYWIFYRINIHRNNLVVVQQDWIRARMSKMFSVPTEKVLVARPEQVSTTTIPINVEGTPRPVTFLFPTYPRVFKNIELLCEAAHQLERKGVSPFVIMVTISGDENRYASYLYKKFRHVRSVHWIGRQERSKLFRLYDEVSYLIFPSKLETWGLPLSEFKQTGKGILAADLPYAHETIGDYRKACFFDISSSKDLASKLEAIISGNELPLLQHLARPIKEPVAYDWEELFAHILARKEA